MKEQWKEIKGNREIYEVSNLGNVRTKDREGARGRKIKGHVLTQHDNSNGYPRCGMNIDGKPKSYLVHRLVAKLFIPNPDNKPDVNHKMVTNTITLLKIWSGVQKVKTKNMLGKTD